MVAVDILLYLVVPLLIALAVNLSCLVLPFLIRNVGEAADKNRQQTLIIFLVVALLLALAVDWAIIGWLRVVTRPDFA